MRRILQAVIVLLGITLLTFILLHNLPGGAARSSLGIRATPQAVAEFNQKYGYNLPLWRQYLRLVDNLLHGNFGYSFQKSQSVSQLITENVPRSLILVGASLVLSLIVAIPLGIFQVVRRNKPSDYMLTGTSFAFYAMPPYLLGLILIMVFSQHWHLFPFEAPQTQGILATIEDPRAMVLPIITLSAVTIASFSRYMRSSMMDAMTQDYIRTARAKGASSKRVVFGHALRNALLPIITLLGVSLPFLVGGALLTEVTFNYPGMGLLIASSAVTNDQPVIIGTTIFLAIAVCLGSLVADLAYGIADPRIRYGK